MRAEGASQGEISEATGIKHSTLVYALDNEVYIGKMRHNDEWLPGIHEPLVSIEQFEAAHDGRVPGRKRGKDLMSGRIVCGMCGRRMSIESNGKGQSHYRCKHRGTGCDQPARSNRGLLTAAVLAMELLCDEGLQEAIRQHLEAARMPDPGRQRTDADTAKRLKELRQQREKLLALHYADNISAEQFGEEQAKLTIEIENIEHESTSIIEEQLQADDLATRFEQVATLLSELNLGDLWDHATDQERRQLLDELLQDVTIHPDRLASTEHQRSTWRSPKSVSRTRS